MTRFYRLSEKEQEVLRCFDKYGELIVPEYIEHGSKTIAQLIKRGIVLKTVPFTLSKLGKRLKKDL